MAELILRVYSTPDGHPKHILFSESRRHGRTYSACGREAPTDIPPQQVRKVVAEEVRLSCPECEEQRFLMLEHHAMKWEDFNS